MLLQRPSTVLLRLQLQTPDGIVANDARLRRGDSRGASSYRHGSFTPHSILCLGSQLHFRGWRLLDGVFGAVVIVGTFHAPPDPAPCRPQEN